MAKRDLFRLKHMFDFANIVISFAKGKKQEELISNTMLYLSITRGLEIIGEAANSISEETKKKYPHIPWRDMIDMRNRLVHVYFDLDASIIWQTVKRDLPLLIADLKVLIPKHKDRDESQ